MSCKSVIHHTQGDIARVDDETMRDAEEHISPGIRDGFVFMASLVHVRHHGMRNEDIRLGLILHVEEPWTLRQFIPWYLVAEHGVRD